MRRRSFAARVRSDGRVWLIAVDGVGVSQARRLGEAEAMARDLVVTVRGLDPGSFDLTIEIELPREVQALTDRARTRQGEAEIAQTEAGQLLRSAIATLLHAGHSQRDIAAMLGLSHQRVSQLAASERRRSA